MDPNLLLSIVPTRTVHRRSAELKERSRNRKLLRAGKTLRCERLTEHLVGEGLGTGGVGEGAQSASMTTLF